MGLTSANGIIPEWVAVALAPQWTTGPIKGRFLHQSSQSHKGPNAPLTGILTKKDMNPKKLAVFKKILHFLYFFYFLFPIFSFSFIPK
jgi:hypothetical protein